MSLRLFPKASVPGRILKCKPTLTKGAMGMPALFYCWYFCADRDGVKSLRRNVVLWVGTAPIGTSLINIMEDRIARIPAVSAENKPRNFGRFAL
jgi:hypothetical protein